MTSLRPLVDLDPLLEPAIGIGNHGGTFHAFGAYGPLLIDELSIHSRALTAGEVFGIFSSVPEPSSISLLLLGFAGMLLRAQKNRRH